MFWVTAFLDLAPDEYDRAVEFWRGVTGFGLSPTRGEQGEFATLEPPEGEAHLKVQRLAEGPSRLHVDVHVDDPAVAAADAEALGGTVVTRHELGYVVMSSPGGFTFCFVRHPARRPPPPADWGDGLTSAVDQVCLDVPEPAYETECRFWQAVTGWELRFVRGLSEFRRLIRPPDQPMQFLLQRLGEQSGPVRAHFDMAASDQRAEIERHRGLGAEVAEVGAGWTVMMPPAGPVYCITGRSPGMRMLPGDGTG